MESRIQAATNAPSDAAFEFIRFCHRRRRVGWPELYDEMCAVASRGLYHGWDFAELAEHGIAFGLVEMPRLAAIANQVAREDTERRGRLLVGVIGPVRSDAMVEEASEQIAPRRVLVRAAN